jgi:hypothetical protein
MIDWIDDAKLLRSFGAGNGGNPGKMVQNQVKVRLPQIGRPEISGCKLAYLFK